MHTQAIEGKVEMTREEAAAKLEGAANMATCAGRSLAKLPVKDALEIANFLRDQEPNKQENTGKNCWPMCGDIAEGG